MAMDEQGLANRLQTARRRAGLTQQELCQKANLSYSTLAKIERGAIKSPSIFTIQNIAAALNTSLDELIGTSGAAAAKAVSKSGVRFVYFDINGCMVSFFQGAFVHLAADSGVPADVIETAYWHYNDQACRGEISLSDFNHALAERIGVDTIDWQHYYFEAIKPIEGMVELLTWAASNYRIGLLTNIMPGFLSRMVLDKLLPNLKYDVIVDSSEVNLIKPDPAIYQLATERSGCTPSEILFVDDSRPNIMAAEKVGWHVLWFDGYDPDQSITRIRSALEPALE
jgi:FMN phosphatase YigB (HAD superfamily)/DNA-binding XRE family transcriptional regulator